MNKKTFKIKVDKFINTLSKSNCHKCLLSCKRLKNLTKPRYRIRDVNDIVMFIGEVSDKKSNDGKAFQKSIDSVGIESYYITNACKCYPGTGNRKPKHEEVMACMDAWLEAEIRIVKPKIIACLGHTAMSVFVDIVRVRDNLGWSGTKYNDIPLVGCYHPSYVFVRDDNNRKGFMKKVAFESYLIMMRGYNKDKEVIL